MGTVRSATDHSGLVVVGVTLGQPAHTVDPEGNPVGDFTWDDSRLPNGVIDADGVLVIDEPELI